MLDLLIITGGTKGIGNAVYTEGRNLARKIILIGSSDETPYLFDPLKHFYVKTNLRDIEQVGASIAEVDGDGSIEKVGVVLAASQIGPYGGIIDNDMSVWDDLYRVNVLGNIEVLRCVLQRLTSGSAIRVVFFAGGGAAYGYPEFSGYSLTKVATVRAVENIALEFKSNSIDGSIVALAPGAVSTGMLETVIAHGGIVKTKTDISEPVSFVNRFLTDDDFSRKINGRFIHVRDDLDGADHRAWPDAHFRLRRVE
jgi:NAD(P)-dependent dehydrogenase (short-subunit alcohol dehydrogenase family)